MNATAAASIVGVDLAKTVFQLAIADENWRVVGRERLTRMQFERWFGNRAVGLVVMEACGSAHYWARWLGGLGIEVRLLPAPYVRAYVKRNKTDVADACALLEAARCAEIVPVRVKSVEQQAVQALHRTRSLWMATRTSRINALRGFCREFGINIAQGARVGLEQIARVLAEPRSAIPDLIRGTMRLLVEEIRLLEARIGELERALTQTARQSPACLTLLTVPGVGLLTATAMVAATSGSVNHFGDARHFSSWFGLTPKEFSSGSARRLGRISKRGDRYLRMLLTHGARSVLRAASAATRAGRSVDALRAWALAVQARTNHNKATCALANKLARIGYACLRDATPYGEVRRPEKKITRSAFPVAN
jgi:transposase